MVMEQANCNLIQLSSALAKMISDYQLYNLKIGVPQVPKVLSFQKWKPPEDGWVKVNFDAHVSPHMIRGMGFVFRDAAGKPLLTGTRRSKANQSPLTTEAAAALFGLETAARLGYDNIHLEGDSLTVLHAIQCKELGSTYFSALIDRILDLSSRFINFKCSFVRRHRNTVAHMIARWDTDDAGEKICMNPFSPSLQTLVVLDLQ